MEFRELLGQVRERTLEAYEHQDVPFEKLVDELKLERDMSRSPLFQVAMLLQNAGQEELRLPGLRAKEFSLAEDNRTAKFDMTLALMESATGLQGSFEYNTDLYDAATMATMAGRLQTVLEQVVENPGRSISRISVLSQAEREMPVKAWMRPGRESAAVQSIGAMVARQAEQRPQAVAVVAEGRQLAYGELNGQANQWAHYLVKQGVKPGTRVGVCLEQGVDWVVASLGVLKCGGVVVGLEANEPAQRKAGMLESSRAGLVITAKPLAGLFSSVAVPVLLVEEHQAKLEQESKEEPEEASDVESVACVLYRSSRLGRPVGVLIKHRTLVAPVFEMELGLTESDRVAQAMGFSADVGCLEVFRTLARGACAVNIPSRPVLAPRPFANLLREQKVTVLWTSAAVLERVAREFPSALRSVRQIVCEDRSRALNWVKPMLNQEVLERTYSVCGSSEAGGRWMMGPLAALSGQRSGIVKAEQLTVGSRVYLLDHQFEPTPDDVVGEICLGGEELAVGYEGEPELTASAFVPDAFADVGGGRLYRSGEWARRRGDGSLEFCGRHDGRMVIGGTRVEAEELETILAGHVAVREAAVVMHEFGGEQEAGLVAVIVREAGQEVGEEELLGLLRERLPESMRLKSVIPVEKIARTVEGGIDRGAVVRMLEMRDAARAAPEYAEPQTEVEKVLSEIWEGVLNTAPVGIHDNFFKLGGDSILSIQVIARARQAGVELTPRQLFENQTIAELAAVAGRGVAVVAEQGAVRGRAPLTPFQSVFFEWEMARPEHFNQSLMLDLEAGGETELLEQAVAGLLKQHDALRMRYKRGPEGWEQWCEAEAPGGVYERRNLWGLGEREQKEEMERDADRAQSSLDLGAGRLVQVVEYDLGAGRKKRLLLVIHHLVVDGVSWRILLDDLERGYEQLKQGQEIDLGSKTTSFKQWGERLQQYGGEERVRQEVEYWSSEPRRKAKPLGLDYEASHEKNLVGTLRSVTEELEPEETRALLQDVPSVYNTQINDVLLTALGRTLEGWRGSEAVLVDLEGHGREEIFADVDVSRTVGWFTSTYPVLLEGGRRGGTWEPGKALGTMKEQLRGVPNRGLGYGLLRYGSEDEGTRTRLRELPRAEIIFNYLGQVDQVLRGSALFVSAGDSSGRPMACENRRAYVLDVSGIVVQGKLQMNWGYSEKLHRQATIAGLARRYMECLRELLAHCRSEEAGGFTPSDFVADKMTQDELMQIASFLDK